MFTTPLLYAHIFAMPWNLWHCTIKTLFYAGSIDPIRSSPPQNVFLPEPAKTTASSSASSTAAWRKDGGKLCCRTRYGRLAALLLLMQNKCSKETSCGWRQTIDNLEVLFTKFLLLFVLFVPQDVLSAFSTKTPTALCILAVGTAAPAENVPTTFRRSF